MIVVAAKLGGGRPNRGGLAQTRLEPSIEEPHELGSTSIVNVPERDEKGPCAGREQSPGKTSQLVAVCHGVEARAAPTERHQIDWERQAGEVVQREIRVAKSHARKEGVVLAEVSVGRDVYDPAARTERSERRDRCVHSDPNL